MTKKEVSTRVNEDNISVQERGGVLQGSRKRKLINDGWLGERFSFGLPGDEKEGGHQERKILCGDCETEHKIIECFILRIRRTVDVRNCLHFPCDVCRGSLMDYHKVIRDFAAKEPVLPLMLTALINAILQ